MKTARIAASRIVSGGSGGGRTRDKRIKSPQMHIIKTPMFTGIASRYTIIKPNFGDKTGTVGLNHGEFGAERIRVLASQNQTQRAASPKQNIQDAG